MSELRAAKRIPPLPGISITSVETQTGHPLFGRNFRFAVECTCSFYGLAPTEHQARVKAKRHLKVCLNRRVVQP